MNGRCDELAELLALRVLERSSPTRKRAWRATSSRAARAAAELAAANGRWRCSLRPARGEAFGIRQGALDGARARKPRPKLPHPPPSRPRRPPWWRVAAAAVVAAAIWPTARERTCQQERRRARGASRSARQPVRRAGQPAAAGVPGARCHPHGQRSGRARAGPGRPAIAAGVAERYQFDPKSTSWQLYAANLPAPPAGKTYQLWLITPTAKISAGTFTNEGTGQVVVPADAGAVVAVAVTDEPEGGSPQPTGSILLLGKI